MAEKRKISGIAGLAAGKARNLAVFAARKTKNVSRIAKLNVDIAGERDTIKRAYSEIGKLYFETHRDAPEGFFVRLCQEVENSLASIAAMEAEIVRLKTEDLAPAAPADPDIEVEITEEPEAEAINIPVETEEETEAPEETEEPGASPEE